MKKVPVRFLFFLTAFFLLVLAIYFRFFEPIELIGYDLGLNLRYRLNPVDTKALPLVFVEIDDGTLSMPGMNQFPIPRDRYADVLDALREWGAKQVTFDILFTEPSDLEPDKARNRDYVFLSAIERFEKSGDVLLPYSISLDREGRHRMIRILDLFAKAVQEPRKLKTGYITSVVDIDGKKRFLPIRIRPSYRGDYVYHMALVTVLNFLGVHPGDIENFPDRIEVEMWRKKVHRELRKLPLYRGNRFYLDFPGPWERTFVKISFGKIFYDYNVLKLKRVGKLDDPEKWRRVKEEIEVFKRVLKDKACVIGLTATGTHDLGATPIEPVCPMVSAYGAVFASVWENRFIARQPVWVPLLVFVLLSILSVRKVSGLGDLWLGYGLAVLVWILLSLGMFVYKGLWFDYISPVLGSLIFALSTSFGVYLDTLKERQRAEQEMLLASDIQRQMLPTAFPKTDWLRLEVFFSPAVFVAGDFYDAWKTKQGSLRLLMGDVSGKGISAALYVAQVITAERVLRGRFEEREVSQLMEEINRFLARFKIAGVYATACIVEVFPDRVRISDAGHLAIWLYRKGVGALEEIKLNTGAPLGIDRWSEYSVAEVPWDEGDVLLLFSDGLLEARVGEEFVDENQIKEWVKQNIAADRCGIDVFLRQFYQGTPQSDDVTFIVLRNEGEESDGPGQAN